MGVSAYLLNNMWMMTDFVELKEKRNQQIELFANELVYNPGFKNHII